MDSITGYNIAEAESLDAAEKLARGNPFISRIRICELRATQEGARTNRVAACTGAPIFKGRRAPPVRAVESQRIPEISATIAVP